MEWLFLLPLSIPAAVYGAYRYSLARDDGRALFESVVRLLGEREDKWERNRNVLLDDEWRLAGTKLTICHKWFAGGYSVSSDGKRVPAGWAWQRRINRAADKMLRNQALAAKLNTICDAVETLERSNVIQFRGRG